MIADLGASIIDTASSIVYNAQLPLLIDLTNLRGNVGLVIKQKYFKRTVSPDSPTYGMGWTWYGADR
jgi:hypothetical protein